MRASKVKQLNVLLDFIRENNGAYFKDIAKKFPKAKKSIINNDLTQLYHYKCVDKVKLSGVGNVCKYTYLKDLDGGSYTSNDWKLLVTIFNDLVRMR